MALVVKDRVKEITTTTGTSNLTLGGASFGFQSFSVVGNGNQTYYAIYDSATGDWEVGVGTYSTTGPTLSRDTVLESSNSGSKVVLAAGTKDVFLTYPAERSVYLDTAGSAVTTLDIGTLGTSTANITTANITAGTISTTPTNSNDLVNKTYVDGIAAQGITYHTPVKYEVPNTTGNLNATYNNGASGVGATLTNAGTLAAFAPDGPTAQIGDRILVYNQTNAAHNGVYTVTTVGSGSVAWVLTRAADANSYGLKDPNALGSGDAFFVTSGNTGAGETYVCNTTGTITFGTTAITFAQIASAQIYSAGAGLTLSNLVFSLTPVGTAGTYGSASSVPVFTTNAYGQITSTTNTAIAISAGAVSGLAPSATTDTTNAANITSGTLPVARLSGSYTGITGVGTLAAGTWNASTIGVAYGGTGITSYTVGDLLYADGATSLAKLADVATGNALISGGVGTAPAWGKIGLQTHVSGTLQVANGGTGATTLTGYVYGNGTGAFTASTSIPNSATTATSANTASAIVARDASGNFSAGTITASLSGNASTATSATSATTATNLAGGVAGAIPYQSAGGTTLFSAAGTSGQYLQSNGTSAPSWSNLPAVNNGTLTMAVSGTGLSGSATFTANQSGNSTFTVTSNATSGNTASTIVARDASGNFSAGTITATLSGNASSASTSTTQAKTDASTNIATTSFSKWLFATSSTGGTLDWNDSSNTIPGVGVSLLLGSATNGPGGGNYYHPFNIEYAGNTGTGNVTQMAVAYGTPGNELYMRGRYLGSWTSWVRFLNSSNYNSYAPTLTGSGASGTWGINITGNAATATTAANVNNGTLTLNVSGTGLSGSQTFTANQAGNATFTVTSNATSANTASAIVARDASGNFSAGTITAALSGNASTATNISNTGTVTLASATESNSIYITAPSYSTDAPVKLLNFDWYGNLFSLGNIRSGSTPSNGFGVYYTASGGSRVEIARFGTGGTFNTVGAITQNGSQVLTAGNYNSYAPTLTGGGASGTWGINISGNAATATTASTTSGNAATATALQTARNINAVSFNGTADITIPRVRAIDDRTAAPADGTAAYATFGFGSWNNNNTSPYADFWLMRSYTDATGGADNMVMFRKDAIGLRIYQQTYGSATAFSTFKDVAWTDGTNASGTWGIGISGNAATATNVAGLVANTFTTYGNTATTTLKNSYYGLLCGNSSSHMNLMFDGSGNGGFYRESVGNWAAYWNVSNTCMGIGTSTTSSAYNIYCPTGVYSGGRVDGTIFYDSNNTGYYLDPSSTSELNKVYYNSNMVSRNYGIGQVGLYSSFRYQAVFSMGESYILPADGTTVGNLYGIAWSHPNAGGAASNLASHGMLILENGGFQGAWGGGRLVTTADIRGTIFYDYNNTGYYLDPTSTTALRTVGSWRADSASWDGEFSGKIQYHANNWYFQFLSNAIFRNSGGTNVMTCDSSGNATFSGNVTAYSDRRKKDNIVTLESASSYLDLIDSRRFNWKDSGRADIGFIAQEVEESGLSMFVHENQIIDPDTDEVLDTVKSLDYGRMTAVLWQAVKELKAELNALRAR